MPAWGGRGEEGPFLIPSQGQSEVGWCVSRVSKTRLDHEQVRSRAGRPESMFSHRPGALWGSVGGAICLSRSLLPRKLPCQPQFPGKTPLLPFIYTLAGFSHRPCRWVPILSSSASFLGGQTPGGCVVWLPWLWEPIGGTTAQLLRTGPLEAARLGVKS